jgi:hypothetical protein
MEWYKQDVNDKPRRVGGKQRIKTLDGYFIPINIQSGLPYVGMRPYTDSEWDMLPHVILTSDEEWHPSVLIDYITGKAMKMVVGETNRDLLDLFVFGIHDVACW